MNKKEINFLDFKPTHLHKDFYEKDGIIFLKFNNLGKIQKFLRWITKKSDSRVLELDPLGSSTWKLLNGEKSIYEIILILNEAENDSYKSMEKRVISYLEHLLRQKLIKL